jgi:hypothetical protein
MNNNSNTSNFFIRPVGSADIACGMAKKTQLS